MDNAGGVYSPTGKVNTGVNIGLAPIPFILNGEIHTEEAKGTSGT